MNTANPRQAAAARPMRRGRVIGSTLTLAGTVRVDRRESLANPAAHTPGCTLSHYRCEPLPLTPGLISDRNILMSRAGFFFLLGIAALPLAAQNAPVKKAPVTKTWTPPKTPWGDPDIQGTWPGTSMIGTPLERDRNLGTRNVLNDQEYAARLQRKQAEDEFDNAEFVSDKTRCDPSK